MSKKYRYVPRMTVSSIREMLDTTVSAHPDDDAYQFRDGRSGEITHVTFSEFNEITENLGAALTEMGFGKAHIACVGENSFDWICAYVTVLKSAGVFVPVDKDLPTADKIHVLTESDSTVLFFSSKYESWVRENMRALKGIKCFIGFSVEKDEKKRL